MPLVDSQWYPGGQPYAAQLFTMGSIAVETSRILINVYKKQLKEAGNFPFAVKYHFLNTCGATKASTLNYITLKLAIGRARVATRFLSDCCSYVIFSMEYDLEG